MLVGVCACVPPSRELAWCSEPQASYQHPDFHVEKSRRVPRSEARGVQEAGRCLRHQKSGRGREAAGVGMERAMTRSWCQRICPKRTLHEGTGGQMLHCLGGQLPNAEQTGINGTANGVSAGASREN